MRVWNLDGDFGDECDVVIFIPGPPGPYLVSVGSFLLPVPIDSGTIAAPTFRYQRSFITAAVGEVNQPIIPNPPDNGSWLLGLQVVGGHPIVLNNAANLSLSGQWVSAPDSIIWLLWDGNSRYVENGRNEI